MRTSRQQREQQARAAELAASRTPSRRNSPPVDNGTVALALSGMAFYWLMPMVAGSGRKRLRKHAKPAEGGQQEQA